jgi:O-methyltransferase domain/Dimerisation domain
MSLQRQKWRTRMFQSVFRKVSKLQRLPDKLTPPPFRLMQIGSAFWQSRALYVAAKLDLASTLADQRLTPAELASRLGADPDAIYRLLRMLGAMGIFEIGRDGRVANNALSEPLCMDSPVCVRHMVLMHGSPEMSRPWNETLEQGVREGKPPFSLCHGQEMFDYMDAHAEFDALFSKAMDEVEALGGDSFALAFDWSAFDRVIDVGGSRGAKSAAVLRRQPTLRALVVERPQVVEQARAWWALHGEPICRDRIAFVAGDAVTGPLPAAESARELYLLSAVLHGFDDATCVEILRQVGRAAGNTGAAIVVMELVVPESEVDLTSASFDMQMFMGTRGRERTLSEWKSLFAQSGVVLEEVVLLASFGRMLVVRSDSRV